MSPLLLGCIVVGWCAAFTVVWGLCHAAKLSDIPPRPYKEWEQ